MIQDVQKTYKPKTCKNNNCKMKFTPEREFQNTCGLDCALSYQATLEKKRQENNKKDTRRALKQFNDSDIRLLRKKTQDAYNDYVKQRDKNEPCISCGYAGEDRVWQAGHYMDRGKHTALAFNEDNVHKQCIQCNFFLHGNKEKYRKGLIKKIGIEKVSWLETSIKIKRWTVEEFKELITKYRAKIKQYKTMEINNAN